jgi:hypothetical protein
LLVEIICKDGNVPSGLIAKGKQHLARQTLELQKHNKSRPNQSTLLGKSLPLLYLDFAFVLWLACIGTVLDKNKEN